MDGPGMMVRKEALVPVVAEVDDEVSGAAGAENLHNRHRRARAITTTTIAATAGPRTHNTPKRATTTTIATGRGLPTRESPCHKNSHNHTQTTVQTPRPRQSSIWSGCHRHCLVGQARRSRVGQGQGEVQARAVSSSGGWCFHDSHGAFHASLVL